LHGAAINEAKGWVSNRPTDSPDPTELHVEYIIESERHEAARGKPGKRPFPKAKGSKVFISYRRLDSSQTAGRIFDRLKAEIPEDEIFFDVDSIPIGVDFNEHIRGSMEKCAVMLAIIGKFWINRQWGPRKWWRRRSSAPEDFIETEIRLAFEYAIPIIPILIEGTSMPKGSSMPDSISELTTLNAAPVRSGRDFHSDMDQVMTRIRLLREEGATMKKAMDFQRNNSDLGRCPT
jgi:hypothetical protein